MSSVYHPVPSTIWCLPISLTSGYLPSAIIQQLYYCLTQTCFCWRSSFCWVFGCESPDIQWNPDKVPASVLWQSEDFIRSRTLSGLTFLRPCMCKWGLYDVNPKHHVKRLTWLSEYWYTKAVCLPFFRQVLAVTQYIRRQKNLYAEIHPLMSPNLCAVYASHRLYLAFSSIQLQTAPYLPWYHSAD